MGISSPEPRLTKEYLPERIARLFGKSLVDAIDPGIGGEADVEAVLLEEGVVSVCATEDDLCLAPGFRTAWFERLERTRRETAAEDVATVFDIASDRIILDERENAFLITVDGVPVGRWESRAAFVADVAAGLELRPRYPGWDDLDNPARSRVLGSLRAFLERCPSCDGALDLGTETVSSCCSSYDVVAMTCVDCDARLFEFDAAALVA